MATKSRKVTTKTTAQPKKQTADSVSDVSNFVDASDFDIEPVSASDSGDDVKAQLERMAAAADNVADSETDDMDAMPSNSGGIDGAAACALLTQTLFGLVAMSRGQHWAVSPDEAETIGVPLDQVLEKYFPNFAGSIGAELSLALACMAIAAPRLQMDAALHIAAEKESQEKSDASDSDTSNSGVQVEAGKAGEWDFADAPS